MYAIVKTGGKQYKVAPGDKLNIEKLDAEVGAKVELTAICVVDGDKVETDPAKAAATKVTAVVLEQFKGEKQLVFKFKKRKGYKRTKGHRQQLTKIAIVDVNGEKAEAPAPKTKAQPEEAEPVAAEAPKAEEKAVEEAPAAEEPKQEEAPKAEEPAAEPAEAEEKQDFSKMTVAQLREYAKEHGIKIPSGARKAEIIETIENAQ